MTRKTLVVGALVAALLLGGCGSDKKSGTPTGNSKGGLAVHTVPALKDIVTKIVTAYNKTHPRGQFHVVVETEAVIQQAVTKPTPQVAIDTTALKDVVKGARTGTLGRNLAVIAVSTTNPHHVSGLTAFAATSGLKTKVCGPKTSLGNFTLVVLARAKIRPNPSAVAFDCEAKALADVASNKLDALLMFRVGHKAPAGVKLIQIPDAQNFEVKVTYAVIGPASGPLGVFEKYLSSPPAHAILTQSGYRP
jgi:ABC-type molybdate transport system substrate-binding protein